MEWRATAWLSVSATTQSVSNATQQRSAAQAATDSPFMFRGNRSDDIRVERETFCVRVSTGLLLAYATFLLGASAASFTPENVRTTRCECACATAKIFVCECA